MSIYCSFLNTYSQFLFGRLPRRACVCVIRDVTLNIWNSCDERWLAETQNYGEGLEPHLPYNHPSLTSQEVLDNIFFGN